jgi:hypothetical protein
MNKIEQDLAILSHDCFDIETQLPWNSERWSGQEDNDAEAIRRDLYRLRIEINTIKNRVKTFGVRYDK